MDSEKPGKPSNLLSDLESIRQLLAQSPLEPPLLTELFDPNSIPLLSDIVHPADPGAPTGTQAAPASLPPASATAAAVHAAIGEQLHPGAQEFNRLERELRTAAQLMLQDVIDDFVPQIEAELKRRLDLQLTLLLNQRKR